MLCGARSLRSVTTTLKLSSKRPHSVAPSLSSSPLFRTHVHHGVNNRYFYEAAILSTTPLTYVSHVLQQSSGTKQIRVYDHSSRSINHNHKLLHQPCDRLNFKSGHHHHNSTHHMIGLGRHFSSTSSGTVPPRPDDDDNDDDTTEHDASARAAAQSSFLTQLRSPPNMITMARIASIPYISHLVVTDRYALAFWGCGLAAFSDYLDGYVAKRYDHRTVLGTYLDPLADKIMVNTLACTLTYQGILPSWILGLWISRDVALMVTTYYFVKHRTDTTDRMVIDPGRTNFKVEPTQISKVNTTLQFLTLGCGMAVGLYEGAGSEIVTGLCYLTAGTTIASGFSYLGGGSMTISGNPQSGKESGDSSAAACTTVEKKSTSLSTPLKAKDTNGKDDSTTITYK